MTIQVMEVVPVRILAFLVTVACTSSAMASGRSSDATLIRNVLIADGSGSPLRSGSVRIVRDRIAAVGDLTASPGDRVLDGHGKVLAPGFIDTHSHHDEALDRHRAATELLAQGVTTIVVGQDGDSAMPLARMFSARERRPATVNVASFSGHGTIRSLVMGSGFRRAATPGEVARMKEFLDQDLRAGALGLSTGLEYDPGFYSSRAEVVQLAGVAARYGGRYISHVRSEDRELWSAVDELIAIGREAHLPVQISHAKLGMIDLWGQAEKLLARLDAARASGVDVTLDVYPYTSWQSTLSILWPKRDFANRVATEYALAHIARPENILVTSDAAEPANRGLTLAEIARRRGVDPADAAMAIMAAANARHGDIEVIAQSMDAGDVAKLIAWPHANISSDGGFEDLHPRGAGSFARVLGYYVREQRLLSLPEAVRKMSALAAAHVGLPDRGEIRPGAFADLVIFDPATIRDESTPSHPHALAKGVENVWVNGQLVFAAGAATSVRPGRVLRRAGAAS